MRQLLFDAYLRFPRGFYDHHATGQVVSRATNDLYPIRYFVGWGLVQGAQSVMMVVGAGIALGLTDARLALLSALPLPLIALRSEEHTSELQSRQYLVCRLLLEKN